jgi:DNA invertase Pin-like site-specific DNA recombinase
MEKAVKNVKVIPGKQTLRAVRKRVAAYARVSCDSEPLLHSLSAQVSRYSDLIQNNPEWEFAGVYADAGLTGTSIDARPEFQRLLADCEAGKIDVILTKSISRFARNTVDLLSTVRHLKELGIEVRFERENLHSLSGDGELMLSILASFAQEESMSLSNNVSWSIQKKYKEGRAHNRRRMLGYRWEEGKRVVVPEEAETVRFIFKSCAAGMSMEQIARALREKGVTGIHGGGPFSASSVFTVLNNEQYTGCLLLQRSFSPQPRKQKLNHGERDMYRVDNFQPAIITPEQFQLAKQARQNRSERLKNLPWKLRAREPYSPFQGLVFCGKCGGKVYWNRGAEPRKRDHGRRIYWVCSRRGRKNGCDCKPLGDETLRAAMEGLALGPEAIERIELLDDAIKVRTKYGKETAWHRQ